MILRKLFENKNLIWEEKEKEDLKRNLNLKWGFIVMIKDFELKVWEKVIFI